MASLFKQYLRELPEPLFTNALHSEFIAAAAASNEAHMLECLRKLPDAHCNTVVCLFKHLQKVLAHKDANKMTEQNLATCFGPSLLQPSDEYAGAAASMSMEAMQ